MTPELTAALIDALSSVESTLELLNIAIILGTAIGGAFFIDCCFNRACKP